MNPPTNRSTNLLIVDDNVKNIQVLAGILQEEGYELLVARDGLQALKVVETERPDLILLDVMMPHLDGFGTCQRLKANSKTSDIPVIFLTARTEIEDVVKGFELGAVDYLTKPFNAAELRVRVKTHLTLRQTQSALKKNNVQLKQSLNKIATLRREQEVLLRHELKNRIGPIIGYSEMLLEFDSKGLSDDQLQWLSSIISSAEDMADLIDSLRNLQSLENGTQPLENEPIELAKLIQGVITDLGVVYGEEAQVLCVDRMSNGKIKADANLLSGAFQNLIKNAIEHVLTSADESERLVTINLLNENDQALVTINNRGTPVPVENLATFFEKFNTTKRETGGTGLGTTYAYWVVKAHGGEISVTSNEKQGTTVTVKL